MRPGTDLTSDEFKNLPDGTYKSRGLPPATMALPPRTSYDFRVDTKVRFESVNVDLGMSVRPSTLQISDESPLGLPRSRQGSPTS